MGSAAPPPFDGRPGGRGGSASLVATIQPWAPPPNGRPGSARRGCCCCCCRRCASSSGEPEWFPSGCSPHDCLDLDLDHRPVPELADGAPPAQPSSANKPEKLVEGTDSHPGERTSSWHRRGESCTGNGKLSTRSTPAHRGGDSAGVCPCRGHENSSSPARRCPEFGPLLPATGSRATTSPSFRGVICEGHMKSSPVPSVRRHDIGGDHGEDIGMDDGEDCKPKEPNSAPRFRHPDDTPVEIKVRSIPAAKGSEGPAGCRGKDKSLAVRFRMTGLRGSGWPRPSSSSRAPEAQVPRTISGDGGRQGDEGRCEEPWSICSRSCPKLEGSSLGIMDTGAMHVASSGALIGGVRGCTGALM
mmetsp:Transcript_1694/g.6645  ORF Transcript_1694/g.6645 Transcript_1694/m.6645 type:complete len:358 (-) Transcript_1694:210-1283(-)